MTTTTLEIKVHDFLAQKRIAVAGVSRDNSHHHVANLIYQRLKKTGHDLFPVNPHFTLCKTIDEVIAFCTEWDEKRHDLPYETDGMVVKLNSFIQRQRLGATSRSELLNQLRALTARQ
jgi:NAD-dependent DNA ligase